jgi:BirA family biotin operon repressor/biotin-[acetyl-CoA-carboxylase] ligase
VHLPSSSALANLVVLSSAGSTNDELTGIAADAEEFTVVLTLDQRAGRGRLGRIWSAPAGRTLAASVLLRPRLEGGKPLGVASFGWLPLIAGAAMAAAVDCALPAPAAGLKWPNDVLIGGRKVAGLLAELVPGGAVVMGSGVNLSLSDEELPTPNATSLGLEGAALHGDALVDRVLATYLTHLRRGVEALIAASGDALASGVHAGVSAVCDTIGMRVRVELPGGATLVGTAVGIDPTGRLQVRPEQHGDARGADVVAVAAGDVVHVRPTGEEWPVAQARAVEREHGA